MNFLTCKTLVSTRDLKLFVRPTETEGSETLTSRNKNDQTLIKNNHYKRKPTLWLIPEEKDRLGRKITYIGNFNEFSRENK